MRLTLRTLLAYLDDTLEPQDAEILRQKVEQSGFATQLVQRIRSSLADSKLSAPAPDSVHPIEEPNMMSNYLDSALSPEQIAEIEKACLESLPHLAEAAACHQILTMVLGQPAEVSDQLRDRIFAMVNPQHGSATGSPIAGEIGPRFSDIDIPGSSEGDSDEAALPAVDSVGPADLEQLPNEVQPVGVDDSGVFQAATKLREQSHQFAGAGTALDDVEPLASDRPFRQLERSDFSEGEVKRSRITPWLVTFALVGALLFAIVQIFAPLIGPKVADSGDKEIASDTIPVLSADDESAEDVLPSSEAAPLGSSDEGPQATDESNDSEDAGSDMPLASGAGESIAEPESAAEGEGQPAESEPDTPELGASEPAALGADSSEPAEPMGADVEPPTTAPVDESGTAKNASAESTDTSPYPAQMPDERIASLPNKKDSEAMETDPGSAALDGGASPPDPDAGAPDNAIAKLVSPNALVAARFEDSDWKLLAADAAVEAGRSVVCGPEFRADFVLTGAPESTVTLVGPGEIRWINGKETVNLEIHFGRGIIRLAEAGNRVSLTVGDTTMVVESASDETALAYDVSTGRELGADPMVPENHVARLELTSVVGRFSASGFNDTVDLDIGSQVVFDLVPSGPKKSEVTKPAQLPPWIDPEIDMGSLESGAASDLLELVRTEGSDSLQLSLRIALGFRRNEVAALAGKTMLALGDASAYFGVDGLLSNPKQRHYWSSHLDALRSTIDRSVVDAAAVRTAIAGQNAAMDNADGDTLFRLLTGYSQDQLKTGGDAELVAGLESGSIPVRVLASEHLRDISGTTLFFKPEEEVVSRREEIVKKWKVRLRKESIRYPDAE